MSRIVIVKVNLIVSICKKVTELFVRWLVNYMWETSDRLVDL
jgi:hypothetical protein